MKLAVLYLRPPPTRVTMPFQLHARLCSVHALAPSAESVNAMIDISITVSISVSSGLGGRASSFKPFIDICLRGCSRRVSLRWPAGEGATSPRWEAEAGRHSSTPLKGSRHNSSTARAGTGSLPSRATKHRRSQVTDNRKAITRRSSNSRDTAIRKATRRNSSNRWTRYKRG